MIINRKNVKPAIFLTTLFYLAVAVIFVYFFVFSQQNIVTIAAKSLAPGNIRIFHKNSENNSCSRRGVKRRLPATDNFTRINFTLNSSNPKPLSLKFSGNPKKITVSYISIITNPFYELVLTGENMRKFFNEQEQIRTFSINGRREAELALAGEQGGIQSNGAKLVADKRYFFVFYLLLVIFPFIAWLLTAGLAGLFRAKKNEETAVPEYEKNEILPKQSKYCVAVFVINEGDKLLKQLQKMQQVCKNSVDIVVADGGSSDGSTNQDKLKKLGVNTLLVKTGKGRLGSQMRMAFDWALQRGYKGIVVIDGNGKDGVDAIRNFVSELDNEIDYVQGSRFIKGGHHQNTPLSRYLAVKLLHAPMMTLFSGFRYTDTTNGFRAYSSKLLTSEKLKIFRACFAGYELHYYIARKAAIENFSVKEIPVSRVYPASGKTPTKISPVKGNINVLYKLFKTCLGGYDPDSKQTFLVIAALSLLTIAAAVWLFKLFFV